MNAYSKISWVDAKTVRVQTDNGRDYWLCSSDGTVEFHYPRAQTGDPHGEYDLGRMYYDGTGVLRDQERGLALIRSAAAKGHRHAVRFLEHIESGP
jgi:TPR repeat protein